MLLTLILFVQFFINLVVLVVDGRVQNVRKSMIWINVVEFDGLA